MANLTDPTPLTPAPDLAGVRVLVVEDDDDCRALFKALLELAGASVTTAASAREGLRLLHHVQPHVLVSDLTLPDEDGCWLVENARTTSGPERRPAAIAVTAFTSNQERARCLAAGFDVFFGKPVDPTALWDAVARLA